MKKFPFFPQLDAMDCGPACLQMVAAWYGRRLNLDTIRQQAGISREGVSLLGLSDTAEAMGFRTTGVRVTRQQLLADLSLPCIVFWQQRHFVVVYGVVKRRAGYRIKVADPAIGKLEYSLNEFLQGWAGMGDAGDEKGLCLLLEPTPVLYSQPAEPLTPGSPAYLLKYLRPYRNLLVQLSLGVVLLALVQLAIPFLTQSVVDIAIGHNDLRYLHLVMLALTVLFISRTIIEFVRGWILAHMVARINIGLIADFLSRLMRLPLSFFDQKLAGDLYQRIADHHRIARFLSGQTLQLVFSAFSFLVFSVIVGFYSPGILAIFVSGTLLYVLWSLFFMGRRRALDNRLFLAQADNQGKLLEIINGMHEIKMNGLASLKRWDWEKVQARIFNIQYSLLAMSQWQTAGGIFLNEGKNLLITFVSALLVMQGEMTLGMMLALQYIIGQMNSPLDQLVNFLNTTQDAAISLERLSEVHTHAEEAPADHTWLPVESGQGLILDRVSFRYDVYSPFVLDGVSFTIPAGKVTAIVGASGSGKTTLLKLLLAFYQPVSGSIMAGATRLCQIHPDEWRKQCGAVLQDGYLFADTLMANIIMTDHRPHADRFNKAVTMANLHGFVDQLPLGFYTKTGANGQGLSQGQKQRILIARALYKNPEILFFDEATNALDARNEWQITDKLNHFFENRTVVIVAHRLSTVRNAHQIVVLNEGQVAELGTHQQLVERRGVYYQLVSDQLELGM